MCRIRKMSRLLLKRLVHEFRYCHLATCTLNSVGKTTFSSSQSSQDHVRPFSLAAVLFAPPVWAPSRTRFLLARKHMTIMGFFCASHIKNEQPKALQEFKSDIRGMINVLKKKLIITKSFETVTAVFIMKYQKASSIVITKKTKTQPIRPQSSQLLLKQYEHWHHGYLHRGDRSPNRAP